MYCYPLNVFYICNMNVIYCQNRIQRIASLVHYILSDTRWQHLSYAIIK